MLFACSKKEEAKPGSSPEETARLRNRLNKIFYWQIADELKLSPQEEAQMVKVLEDFQVRKEKSLINRRGALDAIEAACEEGSTSASESKQLITDYRKSMKADVDVDMNQIEALEKIMGPQRLLRFLKSRSEMSDKIRQVIR